MGNLTSDSKASWAAVSSSGPAGTVRNPKTNIPATEDKWLRIRSQIARAYIADPDCYFYQAYLASNRQYGLSLELKSAITALVAYAEGALYESVRTPNIPTPPAYLSGNTSMEGVGEAADILAQRAKAAATASKVGRRLMERGDEAEDLYLSKIASFIRRYFTLQTSLSLIADASPDFEPLRQLALSDVMTSSDAATAASYSPSTAAKFAVQNAAASAALRTTNRTPRISTRLSCTPAFFPVDVETSVSDVTLRFLTQSPSYCYLRVGDVFSWAGGETTITEVGATSVTLGASVGTPSGYAIVPRNYAAFTTLQAACASFLSSQEVANKDLQARMSDLSSQQRVKDAISLLATIQNAITGLSSEVAATLERVGVEFPPDGTPMSSALYAYAPVVPSTTKETTKACLSSLEREGFQLASQRFLSANLTFLSETADMQQLAGLFDATMESRV